MSARKKPKPPAARAKKHVSPRDLFDPGEVSILRSYFGLKLRKHDPKLRTLYEERPPPPEDDDESPAPDRPVRMWRGSEHPFVAPLENAVGRICLRAGPPGGSRRRLAPRRVVDIITFGLMQAWLEQYRLTFVPGFDRYVVTASFEAGFQYSDFTHLAIGFFAKGENRRASSMRILRKWWTRHRKIGGPPWKHVDHEGLLDAATTERLRSEVWPGDPQDWC